MSKKKDPYRTEAVPEDFETRLTALEGNHREMSYVAEKYRHATEISVWAVRWAKFGLYLAVWAAVVISAAVGLSMKNCHERSTRHERAIDECDCDYMQRVYDRESRGGRNQVTD